MSKDMKSTIAAAFAAYYQIKNVSGTTKEEERAEYKIDASPKTKAVHIPDIREDEVEVTEILVAVGDKVELEQSILVVEGDKASMEIPASAAGVVKEIKVAVGDEVNRGSIVMVFEIDQCVSMNKKTNTKTNSVSPQEQLANLDYTPCRLPKLNASQLTDPAKGLWELWGRSETELETLELSARDPLQDIQNRPVAIDFGTSSTVVGITNKHGGQELLRIGVRDFYQPTEAKHFENPTVLEFLDFEPFTDAWVTDAYRPGLNWDWVRASHEAQTSLRDNPGDTDTLASILPRLKQWALRSDVDRRIKLTGRKGKEMELEPHCERNPVRGQPIQVSSEDPLDPIELYAWYLGMTINWRERGLFLKYYLSFPVKYPVEVRHRILASFRRGLQRSFPQSLIEHHPHILNDFEVGELASEPAAYAAAALPALGIEPTEEGVPYAVFDFGGGTSDFDYGILRWANEQEEDEGYERVFEHVGSGGDNFLGAENLLEHLAYETFKLNQDVLRQQKVQFTLPMDALAFPGSELLIANTQAAQTNVIMLAARLRDFMEAEQSDLTSQIRLDLLDANCEKQLCELQLDADYLDNFLAERIKQGVQAFFLQLSSVKDKLPILPIHILLAGNGSRSRHIQALFDNENNQITDILKDMFGKALPKILPYPPLPMNERNPHSPTSKTGVAIGLLKLAPGSRVLIKNSEQAQQTGEAPFGWYVGKIYRGNFKPELELSSNYQEWTSLGVITSGVFNLYATKSPRTLLGLAEGSSELKFVPLSLLDAMPRAKLFVRAVAPGRIEYAHAIDEQELSTAVIQELHLDNM
ncbi:hypothetical protein GCM10011502_27760 [Oceanisphaera marina]|uniref:Lipoyl-binding domain-containing protein n=1 Tax=Oceanisphaera marina TaxID=2017550 RepID=A0ABQ1IWL2_9GAMM|nr:hypothetical protein GCM10011502_27760 [Oceanisphaera marina]